MEGGGVTLLSIISGMPLKALLVLFLQVGGQVRTGKVVGSLWPIDYKQLFLNLEASRVYWLVFTLCSILMEGRGWLVGRDGNAGYLLF